MDWAKKSLKNALNVLKLDQIKIAELFSQTMQLG